MNISLNSSQINEDVLVELVLSINFCLAAVHPFYTVLIRNLFEVIIFNAEKVDLLS
jgi:hypothetical protein